MSTGLLRSSIVGSMSIFLDMYVLTKYWQILPFSMIGQSLVATPSVSKRREPLLPGVLAISISVIPSGKICSPSVPSRNDTFCWIADALRADTIGERRRDATLFSTIIL